MACYSTKAKLGMTGFFPFPCTTSFNKESSLVLSIRYLLKQSEKSSLRVIRSNSPVRAKSAKRTQVMAAPSQATPTHGRIKVVPLGPPAADDSSSSESPAETKRGGNDSIISNHSEASQSSNLLRMVHEKNLLQHVTPETPPIRHTGGAFLRQYSGMQGVPELEGMQQTEAPLDEIEVKTVIELFGVKITRPVIPPPRALKTGTKRLEGDFRISLRVHLQDGSYRRVSSFKKSTGYDLLLQCAEELGCEAPQYFNLCRKTEDDVDRFLDLNMTLESLGLEDGHSVYFKVKYYKQPSYKLDDVSLQLFFVQTKQSILSGNYIVPERIALLLAAFQLQIFYGTYDPAASWLAGLSSNLSEFLPADQLETGEPRQWANRIIRNYQYLYDLTTNEATYGYLSIARKVPACGSVLFPVLQGKLHVTIGIVEDGVIFFKDDKKSMFEFFSFDDLLAWVPTETGVALRLQKRIETNETSNPHAESEYFQMRVNYDCSENQAMAIIDLLEGYNALLSRKSQERQHMLISEGLRPVASPSAYLAPQRRVQDEPFGSKLDFFLSAYRHSCSVEGIKTSSRVLKLLDHLDIPGKLTELRLSQCGLDVSSSTALLHAIDQTQRYRSVVGDRNITYNFELETVNLSSNKLCPSFPSILSFVPTLTSLDLSASSVSKEDLPIFINSFKGAFSLISLSLAETEMNDRTLIQLIPHLSKCQNLETLDISANALKGSAALAELGKMIQSLPKFQKLALHRNKLSDSAVEAFVAALEAAAPSASSSAPANALHNSSSANGQITPTSPPQTPSSTSSSSPRKPSTIVGLNLDLRSTGISSKAVSALTSLIKKKRICVLRLAGNNLSSCSSLSDVLKDNVNLLVLDVGGCEFGKKGWTELFSGITKQTGSNRFDATGGLDKYGWNAFRLFMRDVTSRVCHLEFQNTNFSSSSQAIICLNDLLSHNHCFITTLILKGSTFGRKDFSTFADILSSSTSLMTLNLASCRLDNANMTGLASALTSNTSLVQLNLDRNPLGTSAIIELAAALQNNSSLEYLSLKNCSLSPDAIPCWSECVSSNCTLQIVDMRRNNLNLDPATKALLQSVPCTADILI